MASYPHRARCIIKYKPAPGQGNGLVLAKGDVIEVLGAEDEDGDWLRGRKEDGSEGVFPEQFVETIEDEPAAASAPAAVEPTQPEPAQEAASPAPTPAAAPVAVAVPPPPAAAPAPAPKPTPASPKPAARAVPLVSPGSGPSQGDEKSNLSFKDRLAAFNKPAAAAPPPPRPKPAAFSRKPAVAPPAAAPEAATATATATAAAVEKVVPSAAADKSAPPPPIEIDRGQSMSPEDAASAIKQGGSLKERMAALQGLSLEGPGVPGRAPRPWRKPQAEEGPASDAEATPVSPTADSPAAALAAPSDEPALSSEPAATDSPAEAAPTSIVMPAAPRRAAGPRRKAPSASSSTDVPPRIPAAETPLADSEAPRTVVDEQTPAVPSANQVELGAATEQPGAEAELGASAAEDPTAETAAPPLRVPPRPAVPPPPAETHISEPVDEENALEQAEAEPSLAAVESDEPKFAAKDDEDVAVVPAGSDDVLDEDVAEDDVEEAPAVTGEPDKLEPTAPIEGRRRSSAFLDDESASPRPRDVPSPKGPRAFGPSGPGTPVLGSEDTAEPAKAGTLRPPPIPAPFVRQTTDDGESLPRSAHTDAAAIISEARVAPPPPMPAARPAPALPNDADVLRPPARYASAASAMSQSSDKSQVLDPPSRQPSLRDQTLSPPERTASIASEGTSSQPEESVVEEEEEDPELARRRRLAKRMAALGGVKIGQMPLFGKAPARQASTASEDQIASPIEKSASPEEETSKPAAPRRIPGLPAGAVPIFGMARPPPPVPAEEEPAVVDGRRSIEPDTAQPEEEGVKPDDEEEEEEQVAEQPVQELREVQQEALASPDLPPPPPPARPAGGHRPSIDVGRPSQELARPDLEDEDAPPPLPPTRPAGGHAATRPSIDEGERPPPVPGHRPVEVSSPRGSMYAGSPRIDEYPARPTSFSGPSSSARATSGGFTAPPVQSYSPNLHDEPEQFSSEPPSAPREHRQPLSQAELTDLSERIGASLAAKAARKAKEGARANGDAVSFVSALISEIADAAPPPTQGGGFGIRIWSSYAPDADTAAALVRPGDVFVVEGNQPVRVKGKGLAASTTTLQPGYAAIVEEDFDLKKRKLRVIEVSEKGKVDHASVHLESVKGGVLAVYRVLDKAHA